MTGALWEGGGCLRLAGLAAALPLGQVASGDDRGYLLLAGVVVLAVGGLLLATRRWLLAIPGALLAALGLGLAVYGHGPTWGVLSSSWQGLNEVWGPYAGQPLFWGLALGSVGLIMMLPGATRQTRFGGYALAIISLGFFAGASRWVGAADEQLIFWILASVAIGAAAAMISMRSAVYAAIWFALSLAATAALMFYQGAQFLGVATVVVYAGAIVVTFLFVVMLAQPRGHATYDRISWGWSPIPISVLAGAAMVAALAFGLTQMSRADLRRQLAAQFASLKNADGAAVFSGGQLAALRLQQDKGLRRLQLDLRGPAAEEDVARLKALLEEKIAAATVLPTAAADAADAAPEETAASRPASPKGSLVLPWPVDEVRIRVLSPRQDLLHENHMAHLGGVLFGYHLVSVELAGTLLLVALVGAVAIAIHGKREGPGATSVPAAGRGDRSTGAGNDSTETPHRGRSDAAQRPVGIGGGA